MLADRGSEHSSDALLALDCLLARSLFCQLLAMPCELSNQAMEIIASLLRDHHVSCAQAHSFASHSSFWTVLFQRLFARLKTEEQVQAVFSAAVRQAGLHSLAARLADLFNKHLLPGLAGKGLKGSVKSKSEQDLLSRRVAGVEKMLRLGVAGSILDTA